MWGEGGAVSELCRKAELPLRIERVQDSLCLRWAIQCTAINLLLGSNTTTPPPAHIYRPQTCVDGRAFPASPIPLASVGLWKMSLGSMQCDFWEGTLGLRLA